jgi:RNA polymerase sigma-70 factor (ECF subfamily)
MASADTTSAALERVIFRFDAMLRSVGRRRGLQGAELGELTQEVRVRLWQALVDREKIERVKTSYVYRAALSAAVDLIRRRRARPERSLELESDDASVRPTLAIDPGRPDSDFELRELGESIDRAVSQLAEPRDVVVRLHLAGYDRYEIANMLGWSEPKVRNLIYRGLADLRGLLAQQGVDQPRAM